MRKMKTEFMAAWDGLRTNQYDRVLVLAATNRPGDLDEAVVRRMPRRLMVDLPDAANRAKILKVLHFMLDVNILDTNLGNANDMSLRLLQPGPVHRGTALARTHAGMHLSGTCCKKLQHLRCSIPHIVLLEHAPHECAFGQFRLRGISHRRVRQNDDLEPGGDGGGGRNIRASGEVTGKVCISRIQATRGEGGGRG